MPISCFDFNSVLNGNGPPSSALGVAGDYYLDNLTHEIYGPKSASVSGWGSPTSMVGPQGPQGQVGPIGQTGPQGATGQTGPAGPAGVQGPTGQTGPAGPQGLTGPKGDQGATGQTGVAGPTGPIGPKGDQGLTGQTGSAGPIGPQGQTGPVGPQGQTGSTGAAGPIGPTGIQGPKGDQGDTGPAGPQGPQGDVGPAGTLSGSGVTKFDLLANLRAATPSTLTNGQVFFVVGHTAVDDGGGGHFRWNTALNDKACTASAATDTFTRTSHGFVSGDEVVFSGTVPAGITAGVAYWVIKVDNNNFKLASSYQTAFTLFGGITATPINITSDVTTGMTVNYADDNGWYVAPTTTPSAGRFVRIKTTPFYNARWWGFLPTTYTTVTHNMRADRLQRALAWAMKYGGSTCFIPNGDYAINSMVRLVDCVLMGESKIGSKITASSATPANTALIEMRTQFGVDGLIHVKDIGFWGNGSGFGSETTPSSTITALKPIYRALITNVSCKRFKAGIDLASPYGHVWMTDVSVSQNFYGLYFSQGRGGDYYFHNGETNGNSFAQIAIAENDCLVGSKFTNCHLGRGPYGVYQEAGTTNIQFMEEVEFNWCRFEDQANGLFFTEKKDNGGVQGNIYNLEVYDAGWDWDGPNFAIPTRPRDWSIVATSLNGNCRFRSGQWGIGNQQIGMMNLTDNFADLTLDYSGLPMAGLTTPPRIDITNGTSRRIHYIMPAPGRYGLNSIAAGTSERQVTVGHYAGDPSWGLKIRCQVTTLGGLTAPFVVFADRIATSRASTTGSTSFYLNLQSATGQTPSSPLWVEWWFET